jgi:hypothetical protein
MAKRDPNSERNIYRKKLMDSLVNGQPLTPEFIDKITRKKLPEEKPLDNIIYKQMNSGNAGDLGVQIIDMIDRQNAINADPTTGTLLPEAKDNMYKLKMYMEDLKDNQRLS